MSLENRVLVLALRGRDAEVIDRVLSGQGFACRTSQTIDDLVHNLAHGAGTVVVTEESLAEADSRELAGWLAAQPSWSDFPFVLLATKRSGRRPADAMRILDRLGNVIVLERPVHGETLASAVASALRGRRRQYEARRHLEELEAAEERLTQLNGSLEVRIGQRTKELARANNKLMEEVAERERAQAALVQSQKMEAVGQLTGGIAHDFNNLLTVIGGNLALIQKRSDDEKIGRLAKFALQAAERAGKLTRQLLAFSRSQKLSLKPVDINALVDGMSDLLGRTIGPQFTITMDLDPCRPWALADANQVELAILNLAINARDAMEDGGTLHIASALVRTEPGSELAAGTYVAIRVTDTGAGIPPHILGKVFDPFFTTKPIGKGTGLGLSQVYGIAQQSGGAVRIDSVEGQGSQVEILLQVASATETHEPATPTAQATREGRRERVLVVEDDVGVRRFIVECLNTLGYAVLEAADGREGIERLSLDRPELMIVDFAMPGMNGAEVVTEARRRAPGLPIILATGYADMDEVDKVIDQDRVLRKPFQIDELALAIRSALAGSRDFSVIDPCVAGKLLDPPTNALQDGE